MNIAFGQSNPWLSLAIAALMGLALVVLARRGARLRWWVLTASAVPIAFALANINCTLYGWHGLYHHAYALAATRGWPPEDPIVAGYPLKYPMAAHWLLGHAARATDVPPLALIAALDVPVLLLTMTAAGLLARRFTRDPAAVGLAAVLPVYGVSVVHGTPLALIVHELAPLLVLDPRPVPLDKFFNPNQNQYGIALLVLGLLCLVRIIEGGPRPWRWHAALGAATLAAAWLYPLAWASLGLVGATCGAVALARDLGPRGVSAETRRVALAGAVMVLASLPAAPYLHFITSGKNPWGRTVMHDSLRDAAVFLPSAALFLAMPAAILALRWRAARARWGLRPLASATLVLGGLALVAASVAVKMPTYAQYKFLVSACVPLGVAVGVLAGPLLRGRWPAALALATALCMGAAGKLDYRLGWEMDGRTRLRGMWAEPTDPDLAAAAAWIRTSTPPDAVILTDERIVATAADRSIFRGPDPTDLPRPDGWVVTTRNMGVLMLGHETRFVYARANIMHALRTGAPPPPQEWTATQFRRELRRELPARPVYALLTDAAMAEFWIASGVFEPAHRAGAAAVLRLLDDPDEPPPAPLGERFMRSIGAER